MSFAASSEYNTGRIVGQFREATNGNTFEYSVRETGEDAPFGPQFPFKVWVQDGQSFRWAKVLRTVAYVVVDEGDAGAAITERWEIRSGTHKEYITATVRRSEAM